MRVLFLAPQPFYRLRGMCIAQKLVLQALSSLGHEVHLLTFPFGEDIVLPGLRIVRLPRCPGIHDVPIGPSWQKAALHGPMLCRALSLARGGRYDAVHACEDAVFTGTLLKRLMGLRLVYDMDEILSTRLSCRPFPLSLASRWVRLAERWALRSADIILTNSPNTTAYARRFARGRVVFYHHAPPSAGQPVPTPEDAPGVRGSYGLDGEKIILYVGNLEPYQGVDLLMESLPEVLSAEPSARCVIVGGEPGQVETHRSMARRLGVDKKTLWLGKRALDWSFRLMQASDVLVSPLTESKAVPMKVYSYLASGRPIVATDLVPHHLVLRGRALLAPPRPGPFARAIVEALRSEAGATPPERRAGLTSADAEVLSAVSRAYARLSA